MRDGLFSNTSNGGKLLILFILMLASLLLFSIVGLITGIIELELSPDKFNSDIGILKMKLSQILQAIGLFIVPPFVAAYLFKRKNENYLSIRKTNWQILILSALMILFALPLINWLGMVNNQMHLPDFMSSTELWLRSKENSAEELMSHFLKANNLATLTLNLFVMAVLPAIGEELLFRGIIQKLMIKINKNVHLGIWITAFLFSTVHMQFFTFFPRFFLGAILGYLLVWSRSIWVPILVHFINNALAVILHYFIENKNIKNEIESTNESWMLPLISLAFTGLTIYLVYKLKDKKHSSLK